MTLFRYLRLCENSKLKKKILDCGAGGRTPPLYIFHLLGYETHGIDISEEQIKKAKVFCEQKGIDLGIEKGDMRDLHFEDSSFSFAYSYNTIFHMAKAEIALAMKEMKRILRRNGLLYVNFTSTDDSRFSEGKKPGDGEFDHGEHGEIELHSYFRDDEPDRFFVGLQILVKQKRILETSAALAGKKIVTAYLDYVAQKK
jgi:ubiquinone/menaquinone biosynthesis C-methylase UbiE